MEDGSIHTQEGVLKGSYRSQPWRAHVCGRSSQKRVLKSRFPAAGISIRQPETGFLPL